MLPKRWSCLRASSTASWGGGSKKSNFETFVIPIESICRITVEIEHRIISGTVSLSNLSNSCKKCQAYLLGWECFVLNENQKCCLKKYFSPLSFYIFCPSSSRSLKQLEKLIGLINQGKWENDKGAKYRKVFRNNLKWLPIFLKIFLTNPHRLTFF